MRRFLRNRAPWLTALLALAPLAAPARGATGTAPPAGMRENTPAVHALTGARVVVAPGRALERATVVIRDGAIVAVGERVEPPPDAVMHDLSGKTIYAAFVDAYTELGQPERLGRDPETRVVEETRTGATHWSPLVTPEHRADRAFEPDSAAAATLRSQGFGAALTAPRGGLVKGTSAVILLGEGGARRLVLAPEAAMHLGLHRRLGFRTGEQYPASPMGAIALVRQSVLDARWYGDAQAAWRRNPGLERPETDASLAALHAWLEGGGPVVIDTRDELYALAADRLAREFRLEAILRGSGHEYRRLAWIRDTGRPVLVPLAFPKAPDVDTPEEAVDVSLERLLHWDHAPENAGRLAAAGVTIALTTDRLKDRGDFLSRLRKAVRRGLAPEAALAALTVNPARLYGVVDRLGTVERGKLANLLVTDGDVFADSAHVLEVWVEGERHPVRRAFEAEPRGHWRAEIGDPGGGAVRAFTLTVGGKPMSLDGKLAVPGAEAKLETVSWLAGRLAFVVPGRPIGLEGKVQASGTVIDDAITGEGVWADGTPFRWSARRTAAWEEPPDTTRRKPARPASHPVMHPLGAFGRTAPPERAEAVLFRGATVWTQGPEGILEGADVLVRRGTIAAVGDDVRAPENATVVDAEGLHLTPGMIDAHSHIAMAGGSNEWGRAVSAQVRVGDLLDADHVTIYRQLAGGTTTAHVMHGSANPIGGQCQVIKLRWGAGPEELKFEGAAPTIKFALGENVKQANWGDRFVTRYPQTRMGVEQIFRDEFQAALEYREAWARWRRDRRGIPPRRDLELETLVEVLEGERLVHCHSYRQDEILATLRVFEDYGARLAVLQHILEGYKVADVMAEHGAAASTFSDWWAYKIEVYDAIPHNGALMHDVGVLVTFNSDNRELGSRLNTEAAKAIKYGGLPPEEALAFVTTNAARQLRIEDRVGSIEPGKDADLVLWSGSPLSTRTRALQTWVDGRKYFDREEDLAARERERAMRATLVQKILAAGDRDEGEDPEAEEEPEGDLFCPHGLEEEGR